MNINVYTRATLYFSKNNHCMLEHNTDIFIVYDFSTFLPVCHLLLQMASSDRLCELTSWKWSHETILGLHRSWSQTGAGTLWTRWKHRAVLVTTDSTPSSRETAHLIPLLRLLGNSPSTKTCKCIIYSSLGPYIRYLYTGQKKKLSSQDIVLLLLFTSV